MRKKQLSGEYLAPEVKVVEMRVGQHILQGSFDEVHRKNSDWDQ